MIFGPGHGLLRRRILIVAQAAHLLPIGKKPMPAFIAETGFSRPISESAPYFVGITSSLRRAKSIAPFREELRKQWANSGEASALSFFVGKFQEKGSHPLDLLLSLERLREQGCGEKFHVLFGVR